MVYFRQIYCNRQICLTGASRALIICLCLLMLSPVEIAMAFTHSEQQPPAIPEAPATEVPADSTVYLDAEVALPVDPLDNDTVPTVVVDENSPYGLDGKKDFNPSPMRAVWLSALFPGLGQVYNRRYWKLPIVVGAFMGVGYGANWNNNQLQEYSQAYRDLTDDDPNTKSYMDFFPPTTSEADLDKTWLTNLMKNRRDYYRRYRDMCIIGLIGLYLICMVDAYVDASLSHFDISPDVSMDVAPAMLKMPGSPQPAFGVNWAFNF